MKYCIITYGCQMNEADSQLMAGLLEGAGWEGCSGTAGADLVVLNTCSVRERPERKVASRLGELRRDKEARPGMVIAVAGCMAQRVGEGLLDDSGVVDLVLGTRHFHRIDELVARVRAGEGPLVVLDEEGDPSSARRHDGPARKPSGLRAFVPIIRGCTNFCAYCIVPFVRGAEVSRPTEDIVSEVRGLVNGGTREVTLLGQNVLAYGGDRHDGSSFGSLLRKLDSVDGLWRIRFTTCHPRDVDEDLISAMAELPSVCEHIHLPVQAGSDRLLREMNRGYTTQEYLATVGRLRSRVPGLAVTKIGRASCRERVLS